MNKCSGLHVAKWDNVKNFLINKTSEHYAIVKVMVKNVTAYKKIATQWPGKNVKT